MSEQTRRKTERKRPRQRERERERERDQDQDQRGRAPKGKDWNSTTRNKLSDWTIFVTQESRDASIVDW